MGRRHLVSGMIKLSNYDINVGRHTHNIKRVDEGVGLDLSFNLGDKTISNYLSDRLEVESPSKTSRASEVKT